MHYSKRIMSFALLLIILVSVCLIGFTPASASGTGAGLAEWALRAYNEGWSYVWGGSSPGAVDCSGLIYSYCGGARVGSDQLYSATSSGYVSSGIPRVHGLGLYQPGHVGVYVGDGMAVDARGSQYGVCYQSAYTKSWTQWFKLAAVTYVTNGWVKFNGNYYYYEDGQYVVSCSREIGGVTYQFSSSGVSDKTPEDMSAVANVNSTESTSESVETQPSTTKSTTAPTTQAPTQPKALQLGSSGEKVTKLQNRLTELGYYNDVVTGYFGEATESAYKEFQKAAGVTVDGIAGESDLDILYSDSAPKATVEETTEEPTQEPTEEPTEEVTEPVDDGIYVVGEQGDEIVNIQNRLAELGYFYDVSTGYYGDLTADAVIAFQKANNLKATGKVNERTYNALFSENAIENPNEPEPTEETEAESEKVVEIEASSTTKADDVQNNSEAPYVDITIPVTPKEIIEFTESNIESAQEIVMKTNKVANKALANISHEIGATGNVQHNKNFLLWLLLVGGIVIFACGLTFAMNKNKKYECAHARGNTRYKRNNNVRYW